MLRNLIDLIDEELASEEFGFLAKGKKKGKLIILYPELCEEHEKKLISILKKDKYEGKITANVQTVSSYLGKIFEKYNFKPSPIGLSPFDNRGCYRGDIVTIDINKKPRKK